MAASYPSGIKAFPTYANGDQVTPTTINDPNLEITAIENGLLDGLAHHLLPDATGNNRSLGSTSIRWYDLFLSHDAAIAGNLSVQGNLLFTGGGGFSGPIVVNGNVSIFGTLTVTQDTALHLGLAVTGNTTIGGTLIVTGDVTLSNLFADAILVQGSIAQALLTVQNNSPSGLGLDVQAASGGNFILHLRDYLGTDRFTVDGNGNVRIAGNITAFAAANVASNFSVNTNKFTVIGATGDTAVAGTLAVTGNTTIGGTLGVTGNATFAGTVTIAGQMNFSGNVLITGAALVSNGLIVDPTLSIVRDILCDRQVGFTVSTTPVTLYTAALVHSADVGGLVLVSGTRAGKAAIAFTDCVVIMSDGGTSLIGGHSKGAADTRAYSWSGLNLQLTMGANTYKVCAFPILVGTPGA